MKKPSIIRRAARFVLPRKKAEVHDRVLAKNHADVLRVRDEKFQRAVFPVNAGVALGLIMAGYAGRQKATHLALYTLLGIYGAKKLLGEASRKHGAELEKARAGIGRQLCALYHESRGSGPPVAQHVRQLVDSYPYVVLKPVEEVEGWLVKGLSKERVMLVGALAKPRFGLFRWDSAKIRADAYG